MKILALAIVILGIFGLFHIFSQSSPNQTPLPTAIPKPTPGPTIKASPLSLHTIGQITRHAGNFTGQLVRIQGYMLVSQKNYVIFSDEASGAISSFDLPVIGPGIDTLIFKQKYELQGKFIYGGLNASNHNSYHLELSTLPQLVK